MNSYELSRAFWNWAFENPDKVKPNHIAIYFFAIEHCNRLGWKNKFGFPTTMAMEAIGIKSYGTYINHFNDLVENGFFELIEKSRNQHSSNIISLCAPSKNNKAHNKALDKALIKHTSKQSESTHQSKCSIDKQVNKEQENEEQNPLPPFNPIKEIEKSKQLLQNPKEEFVVESHFQHLKQNYTSTLYETYKKSENFKQILKLSDAEQKNFIQRFDAACLVSGIKMEGKPIYGRLIGFTGSWVSNLKTNSKKGML